MPEKERSAGRRPMIRWSDIELLAPAGADRMPSSADGPAVTAPPLSARRRGLRVLGHRRATVGALVLLVLVTASVAAGHFVPQDLRGLHLDDQGLAPSWREGHVFGTDRLGRDYLVRVLLGVRTSAVVAATVVVVSTLVGTWVGAVSGYYGGFADRLLMRMTDAVLALPGLAVLMAGAGLIGKGSPVRVGLIIATLAWPLLARIVRAQVVSLKEREFVEAARVAGARDRRIILRAILPNATGPIVAHATLAVSASILLEASLSFLGLGILPPTPTLGGLIAESRSSMLTHWWLVTIPGAVILTMSLAVNFLGDGLHEAGRAA